MIPAITVGKAEEAVYYRVITPAYAGTPLSGAGAARQGGRFNRPGQEALYLSTDEDVVAVLKPPAADNPFLRLPEVPVLLHEFAYPSQPSEAVASFSLLDDSYCTFGVMRVIKSPFRSSGPLDLLIT
ncbi:RES family NAD+ phosphorylase [Pusillimonas sp. SM2304]|uniref:RES family NAD+ phosphorylase n=1 Tax=Pusillimonas sp. SM2304 TaxID=3073241 RepID=UPI002875069A|nr:RES family NAD+ phosphorylase [Pusillimonas sp. SM2304]MDS1140796.1 RES family NAD+ phosphorylase [Pusillimonas sp. SM2304]